MNLRDNTGGVPHQPKKRKAKAVKDGKKETTKATKPTGESK